MKETNKTQYNMPPVIRVFISSTFSDMEKERTYFNENLVPKLNRICAERGVSFFSVDLRWGITEEDQLKGQVLPICLREIDKCRPFFIGILGSRYGSIMESIPFGIGEKIPWLLGKEGKSIAELEMLYAVLDKEKNKGTKNCSFYIRDDALSAELYGQTSVDEKLLALKQTVFSDEAIPSVTYSSLEQFGEAVMRDIQQWLHQEFPLPERISEVRREWYNRELLRNFVPLPQLNQLLETYFQNSERPLLFYGDGARGKTTFLTAWEPSDGKKILINCHSDDAFLYWPSIARDIIKQINQIQSDCGYPEMELGASVMFQLMQAAHDKERSNQPQRMSTDFYYVTDQEREAFRTAFLRWLTNLELKETVYICVNDLDLLEDESSHFLSWLPASTGSRVRLLCSTNDEDMIKNAETLGWNCMEIPLFPETLTADYFQGYLNTYGKNLLPSQLQQLLQSCAAGYPGQLRFVANFLITYGRFHNLNQLIDDLSAQNDLQSVYRYVYDHAVSELTRDERAAVSAVFGLLRCARMSLSEHECFRLTGTLTGVTALEWANSRRVFEQFGLVKGDYWNMRDGEVCKFADGLLDVAEFARVQNLLAEYMLEQLHSEHSDLGSLRTIREKTAYAKALLIHYGQAQNWEKLASALADNSVLYYLSKLDWQVVRVSWMKLYLHSDVDIPAALFQILERYNGKKGDARQITLMVAGLFVDLDYRSYLDRVKKLIGMPYIAGTFRGNEDDFDEAFIQLHNSLVDLKNRFQFRQLYGRVAQALADNQTYPPHQLCRLLFLKCDCERHLRLMEEFLKTCGNYYEAAIRAADTYETQRAVALRGDALYFLGRYEEAEATQRRMLELTLHSGAVRGYLSARNVIAMCQYREKNFDESIKTFDELRICWKKLGDDFEAANVTMNKCNALYLSGDIRGALETAREMYGEIPNDAPVNLRNSKISLLSNIGFYELYLEDYTAAETSLWQAVAACEENGLESTLHNSLGNLVELYTRTDRHIQAVEIYQKRMELHWQRREYGVLARLLREAVHLLLVRHYFAAAEELQEKWKTKFDQIPGGSEFFQREIHAAAVVDGQEVERLKEQLVLAKSEKNTLKSAELCSRLAGILRPVDREQSVIYLLEAAGLYRQAEDNAQAMESFYLAAAGLFKKGEVQNKALLSQLVSSIFDPTALRVIQLWEQFGSGAAPQNAREETLSSSHLRRLLPSDPHKTSRKTPPEEIASYANVCEGLVMYCLLDLAERVVEVCSADQMISIVRDLPEKAGQALHQYLGSAMLKNANEDIAFLVKSYTGAAAEEKLAYYEKCMQIMEALEIEQFAETAGNLATIYRRRNEEEKTFRCHTVSMELFKRSGETRDYLIETMNMSTAYDHFHKTEKAIELLQKGLEEAREARMENIEAAMAGNLSSLLIKKRDPALFDEIMRCFEIEEQYFRRAGEKRDLVISLLNQLVFYKSSKRTNGDPRKKLEEAKILTRKSHFREFEQTIASLDQMLMENGLSPEDPLEQKEVEVKLTGLLATEDIYRLDSLTLEEGQVYHAICKPKEPEPTGSELVHLFLRATAPEELTVVSLFQPKLLHKGAATVVQQYVDWWNLQGEYELQLHENGMVLHADCMLQAKDWTGIIQAFRRYCKFWTTDKLNTSMICIGLTELEIYQELKLKLLQETQ